MNGSEPMKNKIYFSKSNTVPKVTVDKIRRYILKFDVEIKEFTGGTYNNSVMNDCEYLIVLPPGMSETSKKPTFFNVGRGIYQQTQYFYDTQRKSNNILFVSRYHFNPNSGEIDFIGFSKTTHWSVTNHTDYVNYGQIYLNNYEIDIHDYFSLKKPADSLGEIIDSNGWMVIPCNTSEPIAEWDEIYSEWFTEPTKVSKKLNIPDLVVNPEDPEDYSLLLTI